MKCYDWEEDSEVFWHRRMFLISITPLITPLILPFLPKELSFFFNPCTRICLLILERGRGRERGTSMWEGNIGQLPPLHAATGDRIHSLGMYPDRIWNSQPFGVQDDALTKWATQPGQNCLSLPSKLTKSGNLRAYQYQEVAGCLPLSEAFNHLSFNFLFYRRV